MDSILTRSFGESEPWKNRAYFFICIIDITGREVMHNWFMLTNCSHFNTWQYGHRWQSFHKTDKLPKVELTISELIKTIPFSEFLQSLITIRAYKRGASLKVLLLLYWLWLKPGLSSQWSIVQGFIRDFFCIGFVWLSSQREVSQTKLMQTKSHTKLCTRKTRH